MRASGWPLRIGILVLVGVGIFLGASIPQGPPERSGQDPAGLRGSIVLYEDPGIEPGTSTNLSLTELGTGRNASLSNDLRAQIRQGTRRREH